MQETAPLSPEPIFMTMTAFQHSAALKAAIDLNLFTKIAEGNRIAGEIAEACSAAERGIRILCDSLTVLGFLSKTGSGYDLTDLSATFLNRHSPAYMGDAADFLNSEKQMQGFLGLTDAVRNGGSVVSEEGSLEPDSPMWVKFARGMMPLMAPPAQMMTEAVGIDPNAKLKILDIAAGHGIFGITFAQKFPNADVYAVDWANVLEVAKENAAKAGVSDRHHLIPGSAFDVDCGTGYDVILLTNFLHHFDKETCTEVLRKIRISLAEGGKLLTLEFIPNEDRVSPPMQSLFSLVMLAATPAGDAYTRAEFTEMLEGAGFSKNEFIPLAPLPQHLIISEL